MTTDGEQNEQSAGDPPDVPPKKRPRGVLGGIIRTAKATSTHVTPKDAKMTARTCRTCGAGRPDGTDLTVCGYCGTRFMAPAVEE